MAKEGRKVGGEGREGAGEGEEGVGRGLGGGRGRLSFTPLIKGGMRDRRGGDEG